MKKNRKIVICIVIALIAVCAGIVLFPVLSVHTDEKANRLIWDVEESWNDEGRSFFKITFRCVDPRRKVTKVVESYDDNGNVDLQVTTRGLPLLASADPERQYSVEVADSDNTVIKKITLQTDIVLWEDGVTVDRTTAILFDEVKRETDRFSKLQFIMECSGAAYWGGVGFREQSNELGVTVNLDGVKDKDMDIPEEMKKYSCVMIALIDELEEVNWEYSFNGKTDVLRFEASDAAAMLGPENGETDIKEYGKTAAGLQRLMDQIDFESGVFIG
ncbi:MAG: DUF4825 domain-containing protein [Clostridia bacterium]|nr:DUF4825 domain-containing protein [Clostridia bacterium]